MYGLVWNYIVYGMVGSAMNMVCFFDMVFYGLVRFGIVWYRILNDVIDLVYCLGPVPVKRKVT